jgi:hypothetical protein
MMTIGTDRVLARAEAGQLGAPRRSWGRDCGQCEACGGVDDSVQFCAHPLCETTLHRECAARCSGCNQVVCSEHFVVLEREKWCLGCAEAEMKERAA